MYAMKVTLAQAHAIKDFIDEELDNYVERKVKEKFGSPNADQTKAYQYYEHLRKGLKHFGDDAERVIQHASNQSAISTAGEFFMIPYDTETLKD
tara:strand:+ start:246 stop:527 length:282 start_codon:yes stop_codon:yes gene_type:complete